jgi:hypothetical protein
MVGAGVLLTAWLAGTQVAEAKDYKEALAQ